jgi:PAS domain S-box-containing protein
MFRLAFERSTDAIFITRPDGTITFVNPAFERLYGYSRDEAVGRTPRLLKSGAQPPGFYERMWAELFAKRGVVPYEAVNRAKDGRLVHIEATASPILDEHDAIIGFLAIQRDVTQRKQLEEQLRQAQKMEAVGRLAGGVAHDFNNVLSVILSYADLVLGGLAPSDPLRQDIDEIHKAARRASNLTRQLLVFSRRQFVQPRDLGLNEVLLGMERLVRRLLGEDVILAASLADGLGTVHVDPTSLEQVVMNLVVNARDAMPTGGTLTVETANALLDEDYARQHVGVVPGRYVVLTVKDTGVGMDVATQARIFEPFFTTKPMDKGTGLGLSTVLGIVEQSGGSVAVESAPGRGSTFRVYLPRVDAVSGVVRCSAPPPGPSQGSETILLVEDDPAVRAVTSKVLRMSGYRVIEARDPGAALLASENHAGTIDLLVTDVVMPQMNGPELARRLVRARRGMRVLCMSGYTDDSIVRHGVLESRVAFLQKPVMPQSLTAKVREVLDGPARAPLFEGEGLGAAE